MAGQPPMADKVDLLGLADALAHATMDATTGKRLTALLSSSQEVAGLPPDDGSDRGHAEC